MKTYVGLSCLLAICFLATSFRPGSRVLITLTDWITYQVDKQFSVQLPAQPAEVDMMKVIASKGVTLSAEQLELVKAMRSLTATDGIANYIVLRSAIDVQPNLDAPGSRTAFFDGLVDRLMQNEHGVLLQRSAFTAGGIEGVELSYRGLHKGTGKMITKYNRVLIADKIMYLLTLYPVDKNDSTGVTLAEQRAKFFNSITYKPAVQATN